MGYQIQDPWGLNLHRVHLTLGSEAQRSSRPSAGYVRVVFTTKQVEAARVCQKDERRSVDDKLTLPARAEQSPAQPGDCQER